MSELSTENKNPLLCDIETGMCETSDHSTVFIQEKIELDKKPMKVIYFTDPICSSCWGIEPQLRKLKLEYGNLFEMDYRMGGLLPDWSYNSGGISRPSDVAHHWDEVSNYYDMPIDGDIWLEDPLPASYPPSIAFKAAVMQDKEKAVLMLRELRELLFLKKKNITKWEYVVEAAKKAKLDIEILKKNFETQAKELFVEDLELAQKMGVRGFPTLFFADEDGIKDKIYGFKPYSVFENAIMKMQPFAQKIKYDPSWKNLFTQFSSLTSREYSELSGIGRQDVDVELGRLHQAEMLEMHEVKNGKIWNLPNKFNQP